MNIPDDAFEKEFSELGHTIGGDAEILDKMKEICQMHQLDATAMSENWVAFVHSKKRITKLTVENLEFLEREKLSKIGNKGARNTGKLNTTTVYDVHSIQQVVDNDADDLLDAYTTPNNKNIKKRQHTPDMVQNKRLTGVNRSPALPFSPGSFSPVSATTPSEKYSSRKNSGEVICTFGASSKAIWKSSRGVSCNIKQYDQATSLTERFKYMFQKLADKAHVLNDLIEEIGESLKEQHNITEFSHLALPAQDKVTVCGRVCCDGNGKINAHSVVLEGSRESSAGKQIAVDLSGVPQFSLFPGQIVAVDGINNTGNKLMAQKFYENLSLPSPPLKGTASEGSISVVIACGPFSTSDNISYAPFNDLVSRLKESPPDVCILLGPFVDGKNPEIATQHEKNSFEETYKDLIEALLQGTPKSVQLVIVPSQRDAHCDFVYPQPPCKLKLGTTTLSERLHFVADPSTLSIDGVIFGITSTDVLFHLGAEEISYNPAGSSDRLSRLTRHLFSQHSYYPLYPPCDDVNVDYETFEQYARLPVKPHVLVVPSELRYFIKDVDGCCCINPGRLAKGQIGGFFGRMVISPPASDVTKPFTSRVAADIVRI